MKIEGRGSVGVSFFNINYTCMIQYTEINSDIVIQIWKISIYVHLHNETQSLHRVQRYRRDNDGEAAAYLGSNEIFNPKTWE